MIVRGGVLLIFQPSEPGKLADRSRYFVIWSSSREPSDRSVARATDNKAANPHFLRKLATAFTTRSFSQLVKLAFPMSAKSGATIMQ